MRPLQSTYLKVQKVWDAHNIITEISATGFLGWPFSKLGGHVIFMCPLSLPSISSLMSSVVVPRLNPGNISNLIV